MNQDFDYQNKPLENLPPQPRYVTYVPYGLTPEQFEERKEIKKLSNTIGASLLVLLGLSLGIMLVLRAVFTVLALFGMNVSFDIVNNPAFLQFLQVVLSISTFTIPFVLFFKIKGYRISSLVRFKLPKKEDVLPFGLLGVSFCSFANIATSFMGSFFESFGIKYEVDFGEKPSGFLGFMLTVIATAIVPALVEEFACRGIVMGSLRKYGDMFAIVCSSVVFGVMHGNFQQIPFAFLTGLCLGFIAVKTKTIWVSVLVHFFNNFISVIIDYLFKDLSATSQNIVYGIYLLVALVLGLVAIILLKDNKNVFTFKDKKLATTPKKLYNWFFTSGTMIVFFVICFIESLLFFKI
ncbi:MAG: CPBP family intramembrane metalloprotease [Ruminococcaceae bacterium]|nr:CPBP family intramembrane metalloprotease [Oscillospiraceae bacterium]